MTDVTVRLSDKEEAVLLDLCERNEALVNTVMKRALAVYQLYCDGLLICNQSANGGCGIVE